jgi:hypothetical protein
MYDMIIIGGGPAGLSAASYALGRGLKAAMLYDKMGGKVGWSQTLADLDEKHRLPGYEVVRLLSLRTAEQHDWLIADHAIEVRRDPAGFAISTTDHGVLTSATCVKGRAGSRLARLRKSLWSCIFPHPCYHGTAGAAGDRESPVSSRSYDRSVCSASLRGL